MFPKKKFSTLGRVGKVRMCDVTRNFFDGQGKISQSYPGIRQEILTKSGRKNNRHLRTFVFTNTPYTDRQKNLFDGMNDQEFYSALMEYVKNHGLE